VIGVLSALPEIRAVETVLVLDEVLDRPYLLPTEAAVGSQSGHVGMTRFIPTPETRIGRDPAQ
jgi:Lrp/AsnC family transcriptional regulator, leucine-responsive regulatory protein